MASVLEQARRMRYEVGSNLKGGGPAALWTLLLPNLDVDAALVVGRVSVEERAALARLFRTTATIEGGRHRTTATEVERDLGGHRLDAVRIGYGAEPLLTDDSPTSRLLSGRNSPLVYREHVAGRRGHDDARIPGPAGGDETALLVRNRPGEPRLLAPSGDAAVQAWLAGAGWLDPRPALNWRRPRGLLRSLVRYLRRRHPAHAHLGGLTGAALRRPPRYVLDIAAEQGSDAKDARWALVAPGSYASQKVLLFLFGDGASEPDTVVKLAPDPAHRERLLNEAEALRRLEPLELPNARIPKLRFAGVHAGRGVVGEERVRGRPFRDVSRGGPDCPYLDAAATSITALATTTRESRPASEVAVAIRDLFGRFVETFPVGDDERAFLAEQVERIHRQPGDLPVVAQHGDPGAWNLLVDDDDRVVFLDWESAESAGLPLWDLVYFLRSYGALAGRRAGMGDRLEVASRHFTTFSPLHARFGTLIGSHARAVGLPARMVEPFFYACWMHRALKEATRLTRPRLESGHYRRLLALLIRRHDAPALRSLLSGTGA